MFNIFYIINNYKLCFLYLGGQKKESDDIIIKKPLNKKYNIQLTNKEIDNLIEIINKYTSDEKFDAEKNKHIIKIKINSIKIK